MALRRVYRSVREAKKDGYTVYDRNARVIILWKEIYTVYGKGYVWAEVHIKC